MATQLTATRKIGSGSSAKAIAPPAPTPVAAAGGGGGKGPITGGPLQVEADGTYEYVDRGGGRGEWVKVKDAAGNLVGDALEISRRRSGTSIAGATVSPTAPYNPAPAQAVTAQNQQADLINKIVGGTQNGQAFTNNTIMPALNQQRNAAAAANYLDQQALSGQQAARDRAVAQNNALINEQRGLAGSYNTQSRQLLNDYQQQQGALNSQDQANLSRYMSETDPLMTMMRAQGSDPQDIANQQAALARATGIAGGSLDYQAAQAALTQAALSQYSSNPADMQRQLQSYNQLSGVGGGSLDYRSQAAQAYADPTDIANQRKALADIQKDVATGDQKQQEAYDLISSRTGVEATAQERLLAELARRSFESQDRSNREAVLQDLSLRGLRSGGAEIASALANQERLGQDRTLAELGLQANAMQRAQAYTGMKADQSNAMRASAQNALGLQGNLSSTMRGQSFDEAYKRGVGADTASANNQSTRLSGVIGAANQSNAIRNANDTVGMFNTGQANQVSMFNAGQANTVSMFNAGQTNQAYANNQATRLGGAQLQASQSNALRSANDSMRQFQDMYANAEATRVGNLAGQRANTSLATTSQVGSRNSSTYEAGARSLDTQYQRDQDPIRTAIGANADQYRMDSDVNNMMSGVGGANYGRAAGITGSAIAAGAAGQSSQQAVINALGLTLGANDYNAALKTLRGY